MTSYRFWFGLFLVMALGCQSEKSNSISSKATDASAPTQAKPVDVTLALNWYPEAEHGGFYAALVHGYYGDEGLNVKIVPGGPNVPVIADVAAGKIEFGVDNADKLLLLRAQQADVVVVMTPIQNSPRCILVHKKSGLTRLEDLAKTKPFTLAINQGQPFAQFMMKKLNLDEVRVVPFPGGIANFLSEPNYGQQAYSFSEPFLAEGQGGDPLCLMLSDIGFNTYTSVLLTRREMIERQSEVVAKMTRASIRGWKKYLDDPDETNKHIHEQNSQMGLDILAFGVKSLRSVCFPEGFDESHLGEMTLERWQTLVSQMTEIGSIKPDSVKAEDAFTLKFLESR
jgi:NitT/TauT family transport system substrate-binding protein